MRVISVLKECLPISLKIAGKNFLKIATHKIRSLVIQFKIKIIRELEIVDNNIIVVCVVRNGMDHVQKFLHHHRSIGINNFIFLINCSTDNTREYLLQQHDTTLLESDAAYAKYENHFKNHLIKQYCQNKWCLFLDIDELFIYPGYPSVKSLNTLIGYSEKNKFNAVVTQMLDMFANKDMDWDSIDEQIYYDLTEIHSESYIDRQNLVNYYPQEFHNGSINFHSKGIRNALFGSNNGLTKISFFKYTHPMKLFVREHHCKNATLANFSCGLLHYPFSSSFTHKVEDAVQTRRYGNITTVEYELYNSGIGNGNRIQFTKLKPVELMDTESLYELGFLHSPITLKDYISVNS